MALLLSPFLWLWNIVTCIFHCSCPVRLLEIVALIVDAIDQDVYARNGLEGDPWRFPDLIRESSVDALQLKRRALRSIACLNHMWFVVAVLRL